MAKNAKQGFSTVSCGVDWTGDWLWDSFVSSVAVAVGEGVGRLRISVCKNGNKEKGSIKSAPIDSFLLFSKILHKKEWEVVHF